MVGGGADERLVVGVAADHPVQHDNVRRRELLRPLGEIEQTPVGTCVESVGVEQFGGVGVVRGRELHVHRSRNAGLKQLELDRPDPAANLQHRLPLDPTALNELDDPPRVAVQSLAAVAACITPSDTFIEELVAEALSVCKVSSAQARKHAAPSDVFQFAAAWSSIEPVDGTT